MGLNLYSKIEQHLDFEDAIYRLHKQFMELVMEKELDNILDIGCGQGFFLENLIINGKKSYGIDLSEAQIDVCRKKGLENTACLDLEDVEEKFDCATAIFDVINYIKKEDLEKFFKDTNLILNQGSFFIFDVNSYFGFDEVAQGCITIDLDDKFIGIDAIFEDEKLITDITLFTEGKDNMYKKEKDSIIQYYHDVSSLKSMLKKTNFKIEEIIQFNLHGFDDADKLIFICKKID
jgi:cyclopropane fatty-acyl-phospholipid synthase-like methyltransferase